MEYISTRGQDGPLGYEQALLSGLARDGGLYLPVSYPRFGEDEIRAMAGLSYAALAGRIMARFTEGEIGEDEMTAMAADAYAGFTDPDVAPLKHLTGDIHVLELFHGPTIAFKDYAMQFLSRAFDRGAAVGWQAGCHPWRDQRRYRFRRAGGVSGPRGCRYLHPVSGRPRVACAAAADDLCRCRRRACRCRGRGFR